MIKKAFSLAELLIVLAIIGVLTGLCIGAGHVCLQNAYNLYYYRTFSAITAGFHDYLYRGKHINKTHVNGVYYGNNPATFCLHMNDLGIRDTGLKSDKRVSISCGAYSGNDDLMVMDVTIPKVRQSKEDTSEVTTYQILYGTGFKTTGDFEANYRAPFIMLLGNDPAQVIDNPNILPVYIDTGVVGRKLNSGSSFEETYSPISYRTAFCLSADLSSPNAALRGYGDFYTDYCSTSAPDGTPSSPVGKYVGCPIKLLVPKGMR